MNNNAQDLPIEECKKALESCPHDYGTVASVCRVCLDQLSIHAWDFDDPMFVEIDCPRCDGDTDESGVEVCPCLEGFSPQIIAQAIENLRAESTDQQEQDLELELDVTDEFTPLCRALKWLHPNDNPAVPLTGQSAIDLLENLRAWAEEHK